jgi:hypothetical protein
MRDGIVDTADVLRDVAIVLNAPLRLNAHRGSCLSATELKVADELLAQRPPREDATSRVLDAISLCRLKDTPMVASAYRSV